MGGRATLNDDGLRLHKVRVCVCMHYCYGDKIRQAYEVALMRLNQDVYRYCI